MTVGAAVGLSKAWCLAARSLRRIGKRSRPRVARGSCMSLLEESHGGRSQFVKGGGIAEEVRATRLEVESLFASSAIFTWHPVGEGVSLRTEHGLHSVSAHALRNSA